jgi:regulation of enolase protein 1 (concanavalin A-like superfamily)
MNQSLSLAPMPMPLRWLAPPARWSSADGAALTIVAGACTDLFVDPQGGTETLNAPSLVGDTSGDFMLSARVTVDFAATYDAGVLLLYAHERAWAKLCFEYSPQHQPMVVSVVTRGVSDDCNSFVVDGNQVWLRIARMGPAFAFHASTDGRYWQLVRHFALDTGEAIATGFLAQSPTGDGCAASFDAMRYTAERLAELRTGA